MKLTEETIADRALYRRVPSTRDTINNLLIKKLIKKGVDPDSIEINTFDLPVNGCCPKVKVIITGNKIVKKSKRKNEE